MKLALTNDWHDRKSAVFWNGDGILKAMDVLRKRDGWDITFFKKHDRTFTWEHDYLELSFSPDPAKQILEAKPDAILFFGDFSRPIMEQLQHCGIPMGICYSGGQFTNYERVPQVYFVENKTYVDWMKSRGLPNVRQVFGTNTEIFKPMKQPKIWDAFMPATYAEWKRHKLFADAMEGKRALAAGWWQEREAFVWQYCQEKNIALLHHQMPHSVNLLYNMSHTTLLTANTHGGSQRAVLESMACGIPPIVMSDSDKTTEYVAESGFGVIVEPDSNKIRAAVEHLILNPQDPQKGIDYIASKYTEYHYADGIKAGIESIV